MFLQGWRRWGRAAGGIAAAGLLATGPVTAQTAGDHAAAEALVQQLEQDTGHAVVTSDAVASAKGALERATRLRAAGDEAHARLADGLAFEEATGAEDLARAIDAEKAANDARRAATDAGVVGDRERALLEEGIARNGRLKAELDELARPHAETKTSRAVATADGGAR